MTSPTLPKLIGARIKRREDPRLIQGRGTYVDDIKLAGMLHMAFKRSDIAHGRIVSIDTSAAEAMEGVECVLTGAQLAEFLGPMPILTPFPAPPHYAVATDTVRYAGEPVAVVVATDRYVARDAADAIQVEFDPLPVVVDPDRALAGDPAVLHPDLTNILGQTGSNIALYVPAGTGFDPVAGTVDNSAIDAAFANAEVVISQRMWNQRLVPNAMEPRGVVAHWEPGKDTLTVWSSTQNPHTARNTFCGLLGLGQDQVRVIAPEVGGGFGAKINIYGEDYVACAVSRRLGLPVKWIEDRSEAFVATTHGRDIVADLEIAAKRDGTILGLRVKLIADIGAYEMLLTALVPTLTNGMLSGVYDIPAIRSELYEVFTNKTPTDAYRGAGRPEGIYFVERGIDMLARELGMDPGELRRKNFIKPDKFPFMTQAGNQYDSGNYEAALDLALKNANWEGLKRERDAARAEGRVVGLGMSFYVEICGIGGWEHASVTVHADGRITATTGTSPHGQGHETTFSTLLSGQFGVPADRITIVHGDTAMVKAGNGTLGSRSQVSGGTAIMNAGEKVKGRMAEFAAFMLGAEAEAKADELEFVDGRIQLAGTPSIGKTFEEVAAFAYMGAGNAAGAGMGYPEGGAGLTDEAFWEPAGATFPFGCHIAMVEVDRDTGELAVKKLVAIDDCGTVVNPLIVEGQVHGGLAQGIGQALLEGAVYDEDGQLLTGSFMDYAMPRASDLPRFELDKTTTVSPHTPLGTKGIGEAGTIGSTPCIVNAAVDALSPFGVTHLDMPLRPELLWRIIQGGAQ
ncbi:MAG: xanthine dehydrogenase family protein molybdopterin-binding subunit [Dehalococcoidia bacterium]|nr:xanthine dehydrogenase family protein molybdopterin-binding subunit [Dehalococcoidia bacterium]